MRARKLSVLVAVGLLAQLGGPGGAAALADGAQGGAGQSAGADDAATYPLVADERGGPVGTVRIRDDASDLYVTFVTTRPYTLRSATVCAASAPFAWAPPEGCQHSAVAASADARELTVRVPLDEVGARCGAPLHVQAYAAVDHRGNGDRISSAYAGAHRGQVQPTVLCRWGEEGDALPTGAVLVDDETYRRGAAQDGAIPVSRAARDSATAREEAALEAARRLVDGLADADPALERLRPRDPQEGPGLRRIGSSDFELDIRTADGPQTVIVHGADVMYREMARSLTTTPSRPNQEALFRSLVVGLPHDRRGGLPDPERLSAVSDDQLAAHNRELARLVDQLAPNPPPAAAGRAGVPPATANAKASACVHHVESLYSNADWLMKPYGTAVRNQGRRGSCVAFGTVGALETRLLRTTGARTNLSEQEFYAVAKGIWQPTPFDYGDGLILGDVMDDAVEDQHGFDAEARWTYNPSWDREADWLSYTDSCDDYDGFCSDTNHQMGVVCSASEPHECHFARPAATTGNPLRARITNTVDLWNMLEPENSLASIRAQLTNGNPVAISVIIDQSFRDAAHRQADHPDDPQRWGVLHTDGGLTADPLGSLHVMTVVGHVPNGQLPDGFSHGAGGGYLVVKNSWGCGSGDAGYMYLSYDWVEDHGWSAHAITGATAPGLPEAALDISTWLLTEPGLVTLTVDVNEAVRKLEIFDFADQDDPIFTTTLAGGVNTTRSFTQGFQADDNGVHYFIAQVTDEFGNLASTNLVGVNVHIDVVDPEVVLTASPNIVTAPGVVTLSAEATDNSGVASVQFFRGLSFISEDTTAPYESASHVVSSSDAATAAYWALAVDESGNTHVSNLVDVTVLDARRATVLTFTATPASLPVGGGQVTLTWDVRNADSVRIIPYLKDVPSRGTATVTVTETTSIVLTARNGPNTRTATLVVPVTTPPPPALLRFAASPTTQSQGGVTTLWWDVVGEGVELTIDRGVGDVTGQTSVRVKPRTTTTYTLTAHTPAGTVKRPVVVTVEPRRTAAR